MTPRYTELQLDALRELANIASGNAATALSQMLGREVELSVPRVLALPLADAVDACGSPDEIVTGVVIPLDGDIDGLVLLLIPIEGAAALCQLLGVEAGSEIGDSALREIGNILGTSCLNALASMTGLNLGPCPPHLTTDMLGAIVSSLALSQTAIHRPRAGARLRARGRRRAVLDLVRAAADRRRRDRPAGAAGPRRAVAMGSVRMGEIEVSKRAGDELVARGLGSCIGLALVDRVRRRRRAGSCRAARVERDRPRARQVRRPRRPRADRSQSAAPEPAGRRLEAVLAGGARMFELGELDIGARNAEAVRDGPRRIGAHGPRRRDRRQPRPHDARRRRRLHGHRQGGRRRADHAARRLRPTRALAGGAGPRRHLRRSAAHERDARSRPGRRARRGGQAGPASRAATGRRAPARPAAAHRRLLAPDQVHQRPPAPDRPRDRHVLPDVGDPALDRAAQPDRARGDQHHAGHLVGRAVAAARPARCSSRSTCSRSARGCCSPSSSRSC